MKDKDIESLQLAEEILRNMELNQIPLRNVVLKCARLARLTNNQQATDMFYYELVGYPTDSNGYVIPDAFELARYANRTFQEKDKSGQPREYMFPETIATLESEFEAAKDQMKVAFDKNISFSSTNPYIIPPIGNSFERAGLRNLITEKAKKIDQLKAMYYNYTLGVFYKLKFGNLAEEIFKKRKSFVDNSLGKILPKTLQKFTSVYENLNSKNQEDWANAVHSCRRAINDIADHLYPASEKLIKSNKDGEMIKLDKEHYILRLKEYIKEKKDSKTFRKIVGSHLDYIGDRIDAIYKSSTKGSHVEVSREEAELYVIYTYLLLGDILSL